MALPESAAGSCAQVSGSGTYVFETGFGPHVIRTRETLVVNENMAQEMEKYEL